MTFKEWTKKHRIKFCFILFVLGIGISFLQPLFLGGSIRDNIVMGIVYGTIFILVEVGTNQDEKFQS